MAEKFSIGRGDEPQHGLPGLLALLLWAMVTGIAAQELWQPLTSPTNHTLRRVHFLDTQTGWAAGDSGTVVHTTDGGQSWVLQPTPVSSDLIDIFFQDEYSGWALTWNFLTPPFRTRLLRTTDGGDIWRVQDFPVENVFFTKVLFRDSLNGWMVGLVGSFYKTTDGGNEWQPVAVDSGFFGTFPVLNISFYDSLRALACGGRIDLAGVIWRSSNGGQNWAAQGVGPEPLRELIFLDSLHILGVGGDFEFGTGVVTSSDGGETWNYRSLQLFGIAWALGMRTAAEGWVPLGLVGKFLMTPDSGATWSEVPQPDGFSPLDVTFPDSATGYAVGFDGEIRKYSRTVVGFSDGDESRSPTSFQLLQNYPNPFNPSTIINYQLPIANWVTLKVYNALGREIATLVNGRLAAGSYSVQWDGSNAGGRPVSSGIYFYRLQAHGITLTRKMLLIR